MNDKADFTQGSILKKLIAFMIPVLGSLILQAAYGAVDLLVVGRFGSTSGLSAVSTGSQVLNLVTFVVTQFAMGITVLIARYLGEKRPEQIGSVIGGSAVVFTMIAVGLFIVMVGFAHPISVLMQAPKEAVELTSVYVRICGGGIFFIVAYNLLSAIFRGLGDSKSPLLFVFVACIVNVIGDIVLVAGFHMDAAGAAIATVTAQALSVVFAIVILIKKKLLFREKASFTVEASLIMMTVLMAVFMCIYYGFFTHDKAVLEEVSWHTAQKAMLLVTANSSMKDGAFSWEELQEKGLLWRISQNTANQDIICEYANKHIEGELFACDMPSFLVKAGPGMVKITYKAPIRLPFFALMRLWGTPTEITGQVQVHESKQEEFIRLVRGIKRDKETASDSKEISAED